ncbi:MAG TPA: hypothetical protein PKC73_15955 [Dermatophilaceae bacterium]|nr:hypothetical protein [Dermatophilaceae bacterium]HMT91124.1 hypothetical protein [Dermatophilaceae bacterium]
MIATSRSPTRSTSSTRRSSSTRARSTPSRSPRGYPTRRRRRPGVSSTIGAALGTVMVGALLDMSWPVRMGLLALVLVIGIAYVLWRHRAEIAAAGQDAAATADGDDGATDAAPPTAPNAPTDGDRP